VSIGHVEAQGKAIVRAVLFGFVPTLIGVTLAGVNPRWLLWYLPCWVTFSLINGYYMYSWINVKKHARALDGRICDRCFYDLSNMNDDMTCPECGKSHNMSQLIKQWRRTLE
jgi:hypothetical protein